MMRSLHIVLLVAALSVQSKAQDVFPGLGSQRVGISSFTFLKIAVDPRGAALGESFVAIADDASALYWNPSGIVRTGRNEVQFSQTLWFADIAHRFAGITWQLSGSDAIGFSMIQLSTDPIEITTVTNPAGTGQTYQYSDLALGLTYARRMTDQFSFGITARYLHEIIAELTMDNLVFDLGAYYATGFSTARFAIVISHFGGLARPSGTAVSDRFGTVSTFEEFSPPTQFRLGFAMEPVQSESHRLTTSIQLNHPNDNAEHIGIGVEYAWSETIMLRAGYRFNVEEQTTPSIGLGVRVPAGGIQASVDYGLSTYDLLGSVHRFSLALVLP